MVKLHHSTIIYDRVHSNVSNSPAQFPLVWMTLSVICEISCSQYITNQCWAGRGKTCDCLQQFNIIFGNLYMYHVISPLHQLLWDIHDRLQQLADYRLHFCNNKPERAFQCRNIYIKYWYDFFQVNIKCVLKDFFHSYPLDQDVPQANRIFQCVSAHTAPASGHGTSESASSASRPLLCLLLLACLCVYFI